jgi:hypothetical protein
MKIFQTFFIQIQKSSTSTFTLMVETFDWSRSVNKETHFLIAPEWERTRYPRGVLYNEVFVYQKKRYLNTYPTHTEMGRGLRNNDNIKVGVA